MEIEKENNIYWLMKLKQKILIEKIILKLNDFKSTNQ